MLPRLAYLRYIIYGNLMEVDHLRELVSESFEAVNELMIESIKSPVQLIENVANHAIQSGGKRLRPLLVLLSSHACNYKGKDHIKLAAMIEFFHTATLLHDDVIDESILRRGRETTNHIWGNKISILVGDYLFTKYLKLMVEVGDIDIIELLIDIAPQMGTGEIQEFSNRHNSNLTISEYFDTTRAKTSLLFAASGAIGALISKADSLVQKGLYTYGLHLGNAFQLIDDALDYCSDTKVFGKKIGADLADGKITLPLLHVLKVGTEKQKLIIEKSLEQSTHDYLPEILEAMAETNAIEYTRGVAATEIDFAISALQILPDSRYKSALEDLAHYVVRRSY